MYKFFKYRNSNVEGYRQNQFFNFINLDQRAVDNNITCLRDYIRNNNLWPSDFPINNQLLQGTSFLNDISFTSL